MATSVHLLTLGCARNDVDSEELAARLSAGGFEFVDEVKGGVIPGQFLPGDITTQKGLIGRRG